MGNNNNYNSTEFYWLRINKVHVGETTEGRFKCRNE